MLLRPGRLSLGLGLGPSVVSISRPLARQIGTGPTPRHAEDEEEGPTIALGGPPPPPPLKSGPGAYSSASTSGARSSEPFKPSSDVYVDSTPELGKGDGQPIEFVAPADVRVRVEGVPRELRTGSEGEAPLLLSADAPPAGVPQLGLPSEAARSAAASPFKSDTPTSDASSGSASSSTPPDSEPVPAVTHSAPSSSASANVNASAKDNRSTPAPPTQEEWERKFEELQAAYHKKMGEVRTAMDQRLKTLAVHTGETLAIVSQKVNEVTGYREVERLKQSVKDREQEIRVGRRNVREAKKAYEDAVATLSSTQQSVNALLERKHSWTDADVANFTKLVRSDHASRSAVATTNEALKDSELAVDKAFTGLMQSILERYHEEQVWSDKIRSVSTWAQVAALVANLIVFVGAIAFIEPWKRRRLVQGLEERVSGMMGRVEGEISSLSERIESLDGKMALAATAMAASSQEPGSAAPREAAAPDTEAILAAALSEDPEAPTANAADPNAEAVAQLVGNLLSDALSDVNTDVDIIPASISPLDQVASATLADTYTARTLHWASAQLSHIATPSAERDLAAAGVLGAAAGMAAVGVFTLAASLLRPS